MLTQPFRVNLRPFELIEPIFWWSGSTWRPFFLTEELSHYFSNTTGWQQRWPNNISDFLFLLFLISGSAGNSWHDQKMMKTPSPCCRFNLVTPADYFPAWRDIVWSQHCHFYPHWENTCTSYWFSKGSLNLVASFISYTDRDFDSNSKGEVIFDMWFCKTNEILN